MVTAEGKSAVLKLYIQIIVTLGGAVALLYSATALLNLHSTLAAIAAILAVVTGIPILAVSGIQIGKTFATHIRG